MHMPFEYFGTAYRQALDPKAPWLVSFVAPAEDVYKWAGIPRRTDNALTGFQRPDEEARVQKAHDYFSKFSTNQSPTSLVLGLHKQNHESPRLELTFLEEASESNPNVRKCHLRVWHDPEEALIDSLERLKAQIRSRLSEDEEQSETSAEEDSLSDQEASADSDSEDDDRDGIELGRSLLQGLLSRLEDEAWCRENETHLRDLAKPATIIDGQHRILGAKRCERRVPFSIIAIHDCTWAEQVFQFTVVNYTAKGIPDQFITANAALSLTSAELASLESRLQQAGVKVIEYELMRVINFDTNSPFNELVNLTPTKKDHLIGYKTMVQIGKAWYLGKDNAVRLLIDHLYPDLPGRKNAKSRLERWKQEHWGIFFQEFWNVVHAEYADKRTEEGHSLWTVGKSNLMIVAVLQQLQAQFLLNLTAQDESFFEVPADDALDAMRAKVRKRAQNFIGYFPPELFGKPWKLHSLNLGPGREVLNTVFRQLVETKGSFQWRSSGLLTGKVAAQG